MKDFFILFFGALFRAIFSLRYRVQINGLDTVLKKCQKGILILPNHTAHVDPPLLFAWLWRHLRMRPLIVETIARLPFVRRVLPLFSSISIPDFETSINQFKLRRAKKALNEVKEGLTQGDNILLYPSGKFKHQGKELVGGAAGAYEVLQQVPEAHVLLIRISGLWGSSFSKALTGTSPDFFQAILHGFRVLFKNGIFFAPRRTITLDLELDPPDLPRREPKAVFNRYLESWYNRYLDEAGHVCESEPLKLIPYQFWSKETAAITEKQKKREVTPLSAETKAKILSEIRRILENPALEIPETASLSADLGMDSLNLAELATFLIHNYDLKDVSPEDLQTVQTVFEVVSSASPHRLPTSSHHWPIEPHRLDPQEPLGKTFPAAFLATCKRMGSSAAMADDLTGVLSYKRCKKVVLVLAQALQQFPEERIAVLLPSSTAAMLLILALHFAGKIPVMLNWTLGPRYLEGMMQLSGAKRVISSWRFLEKLNHVNFGSVSEQILFLEDIRFDLSFSMKLRGALLSLLPPSFLLKALQLDPMAEDRYAVILFSSGTESLPKGIPLSHKNILAAIRNSLWNYRNVLSARDVEYGILPCFHSFGFTVSGFLAILSGLRIAFYPNPLDTLAVAEGIQRWQITYLPTVPTLLKRLLQTAQKEQLTTLRFFITAGERTPPELFEKIRAVNPTAQLTEGYGLTETSPTLTIMRPELPPRGVGQLLPHIELITIDRETQEPLAPGAEGEICVCGPNIFQGYLGDLPQPFLDIQGKRWLRTGDIGRLDPDRTLFLTGRMKRFVKLGGEMVSLEAVETALRSECLKKNLVPNDLPALAICPLEQPDQDPKLILFATFAIEKETLNQLLKELGFSNLVKISSVQKLVELPLIGVGKINYRELQKQIVDPLL